jgi:hypothetical protein
MKMISGRDNLAADIGHRSGEHEPDPKRRNFPLVAPSPYCTRSYIYLQLLNAAAT